MGNVAPQLSIKMAMKAIVRMLNALGKALLCLMLLIAPNYGFGFESHRPLVGESEISENLNNNILPPGSFSNRFVKYGSVIFWERNRKDDYCERYPFVSKKIYIAIDPCLLNGESPLIEGVFSKGETLTIQDNLASLSSVHRLQQGGETQESLETFAESYLSNSDRPAIFEYNEHCDGNVGIVAHQSLTLRLTDVSLLKEYLEGFLVRACVGVSADD